jgi:hypothetical protein
MPLKINDFVKVIDPKDFNEGSVGFITKHIPEENKYVVGIKDHPHYYEKQLQTLGGGKRRTNKRKSRKSRKSRRSRR